MLRKAEEQFVREFLQERRTTSLEINAAWKAAGRLGFADDALSLMTRAGTLKCEPLGQGQRGSRYTIVGE